jgi:hypothetical protein
MDKNLNILGEKYINNKHKYYQQNKKNIKRMNQSTFYPFHSLEGLENMNDTHDQTNKLKSLENEFNKKLAQYGHYYKSYLMDLKEHSNSIVHNFKNKNIYDKNGKIYFVNNFGYVRGYSNMAWDKKPGSCPSNKPSNESYKYFNHFKKGLDYSPGQPCNLDGKLIVNRETNTIAFITEDGRRKEFPSQEIYQKVLNKGYCKSSPVVVDNNIFNMFPKAEDMTIADDCRVNLTNSIEYGTIVQLNNDLIKIANEIYDEIVSMENTDKNIENVMSGKKKQLLDSIQNLKKERNNFNEFNSKHKAISANWQELKLQDNSNYYKYIMWSLLAVSLGVITFKHMSK